MDAGTPTHAKADFSLRDLESWAPDSLTGRLTDHLDHGDMIVVVGVWHRGLPNLGRGGQTLAR